MEPSPAMTDATVLSRDATPRPASSLTAVGTLVAARDLGELALAAALVPAQLLGAGETVVRLRSTTSDITERHPAAAAGGELERWANGLVGDVPVGDVIRNGSWLAIAIDAGDGSSGLIAVSVAVADDETARGAIELARIVSNCVAQIASSRRRATALEDARKSIGKGLHDLRTPLNSLRLGLHLLEPGLVGQDPQVVQRTHRAVDRLAALVTEMYETLNEKTATP
jgi:signal transduction histidine kinase